MNQSRTFRQLILAAATIGVFCLTGLANRPASLGSGPVRQIVIVFKTHFDIGYTDMAANVVRRYQTAMIDQALEVCDQSRGLPAAQQFVWTIPGWPMSKIAGDWPGQTAERKERVRRAMQEGRFAVHALPFTTHTELLELEDLVRGLTFSSRVSRAVSRPLPRDAKMTDVPSHSWVMPTLLKHAGVDFLHLGCNAASRSPQVPPLFWWEGPDGSRLLTMYTAEGYGTGLIPPQDWPLKTWLALIHTGDNHGPPKPDEVRNILEEARVKLPGVNVRIGRLSDFADALLAEKPALPIVRGDMPDTWIHGPMSDPLGMKLARNIRPAMAAAESLLTQSGLWELRTSEFANTMASAYEQSLLYGEHTWGGALYWVTKYNADRRFDYGEAWKTQRAAGRFQRLEDSWREHTAYIESARDLVLPLLAKGLNTLAAAVKTTGRRIVVYNPLPWQRDGLVTIGGIPGQIEALKAIDNEEVLPVESSQGTLRFVARDVPPMGFRSFVPAQIGRNSSDLGGDTAKATIENRYFKATVDPASGSVRSLVDKRSGRELVDMEASPAFGQYLYEHFDADNVQAFVKAYVKINAEWAINELGKPNMPPAVQVPYRAASPKNCKLRVEKTSISVAAVMDAAADTDLPHATTTRLILYANQPYADLELTLHHKPADPWPEAGWICLPLKVDKPRFRFGRLASIVDAAKDIVPGTNRHLLGINGGIAVTSSDGHGAGICPLDDPLVSFDNPGCWKYSTDFVPQKAAVFVNLFNNQWTTNFRFWNEGTWAARVRIWSIDRYESEASLVTPSYEARFPLFAGTADGPAGPLPPSQMGLKLNRKGVAVTAFSPNPDGTGLVLRLWELAGQSGTCRIHLPSGLKSGLIQPTDLRGRPKGQALPIKDAAVEVTIGAFAPASFVISSGT